jgi:hypothetical protein
MRAQHLWAHASELLIYGAMFSQQVRFIRCPGTSLMRFALTPVSSSSMTLIHIIPHTVRLSQRTAVHQPSWLDTISITQVKALAWALINETTKIKLERLQTFHMNLAVPKISIRISVLFWVCLWFRI